MTIEVLKTAVDTYVNACRGMLHDDATAFVGAVNAFIAEAEKAPEVSVPEVSVPEVQPEVQPEAPTEAPTEVTW